MMEDEAPVEVDCRECSFCRVVSPDDEVLAAEVATEHGSETDHTLSLTVLEGE